jgi:hypothetical protein
VLKRFQVLLPDWLEDYLTILVDRYDLSFSEVIRIALCIEILTIVPLLFPEYKPEIDAKKISELIEIKTENNIDQDEIHRFMSKIYFESRKAAEYRHAQEKKKEGKKEKK